MKEDIFTHLNDPKYLERMYRRDKSGFKQVFNALYPELKGNKSADFWNERLNFEDHAVHWPERSELIFFTFAALITGLLAKLPAILQISEDFFYPRNIGFLLFSGLSVFFAWKNKLPLRKTALLFGAYTIGLVFINLLPHENNSDTLILSCIHLILFLWLIFYFIYIGEKQIQLKRLDFLKFNGDLIVVTSLIVFSGAIMSGMTIGLFSLIGFEIQKFYTEYVVVFGMAAAPMAGTYLIRTNPHLVGKISPVIASIFSPLVLLMLLIYLAAIIYSGMNPYTNREFLLVFNALLIGVLALIFFSVAESSQKSRTKIWILFMLSLATIIVNGVALSAILFRISEWGITPNRIAVMGGNILILIHLLMVTVQLYRIVSAKSNLKGVSTTIVFYLPVYFIWSVVVTFIFPFIFGFK